jgi:hypothetical protein
MNSRRSTGGQKQWGNGAGPDSGHLWRGARLGQQWGKPGGKRWQHAHRVLPDFHFRDSGRSGMGLRCRTYGLDPIPADAFLASLNHRFWTGARRRPAISRWVACGWRFRPKVFLVVLCDFNRLSEVAWLEVLAVNSHGGSSPPPRTTEPLGNKGVFVVWVFRPTRPWAWR